MSFIQNAQELLTEQEFATLQSLNAKSTAFETTMQEETQRAELIKKVHEAVATRDKAKNLAFLSGKAYTIKELMDAAGYDKEEQLKYFRSIMDKKDTVARTYLGKVGTYKIAGKDTDLEFKDKVKMAKTSKEAFAKLGAKALIAGATEEFKNYLKEADKLTRGDKKDQLRYPNIPLFITRMGLDKNAKAVIMKELQISESDKKPKLEEAA